MDDRRFDAIAKSVANGWQSRRKVVQGLVAGLAAAAAFPLGDDAEVDAEEAPDPEACLANGQVCRTDKAAPPRKRCNKCCSKRSERGFRPNRRRCVCRKLEDRCARDFQCCTGLCERGRCAEMAS